MLKLHGDFACTSCITNRSVVSYSAPSCGDYEYWDLGWYDDNGPQTLWGDDGLGGEDPAATACNPTDELDGQYQLCENIGTVPAPDWECTVRYWATA